MNSLPWCPENTKQALEKLIRATTAPIRKVFRARIILLAMQGNCHSVITRLLNTSYATVRKWIKRFNQNPVLESLEDAKRSGRPHIIPSIAKCEIIKFACSDVKMINPDFGNTWTINNLQKCVKKSTGVSVSRSEISRILNSKDLKPHKVKMWLHSPDPCFQEKVTAISSLYLNPPSDGVVLCVDEKSGMQALERKRSLSSNGTIRLDYEYKRHGTQSLIAGYEPITGKIFGHCGKTRKKEDIMRFMEEVAIRYPKQRVYVIWDNLNIHHGYRWYEFNKRHGNRFCFVYTPVHGSWVNQIEIWFGILQKRLLKNSSIESEEILRNMVLNFIDKWNALDCHPFKWQFRGYIRKAA